MSVVILCRLILISVLFVGINSKIIQHYMLIHETNDTDYWAYQNNNISINANYKLLNKDEFYECFYRNYPYKRIPEIGNTLSFDEWKVFSAQYCEKELISKNYYLKLQTVILFKKNVNSFNECLKIKSKPNAPKGGAGLKDIAAMDGENYMTGLKTCFVEQKVKIPDDNNKKWDLWFNIDACLKNKVVDEDYKHFSTCIRKFEAIDIQTRTPSSDDNTGNESYDGKISASYRTMEIMNLILANENFKPTMSAESLMSLFGDDSMETMIKVTDEDKATCEKYFSNLNEDDFKFMKLLLTNAHKTHTLKSLKPYTGVSFLNYLLNAMKSNYLPLTIDLWKKEFDEKYENNKAYSKNQKDKLDASVNPQNYNFLKLLIN